MNNVNFTGRLTADPSSASRPAAPGVRPAAGGQPPPQGRGGPGRRVRRRTPHVHRRGVLDEPFYVRVAVHACQVREAAPRWHSAIAFRRAFGNRHTRRPGL